MPTIIDDALQLLDSAKSNKKIKFGNTNGRNAEDINVIASFEFPKSWSDGKRWAVTTIISGAIYRLAKKDRLYSTELGAAELERDWKNSNYCHYLRETGEIAPNLEDIKNFIDTTLRKEFANPDHWVRYKTKKGIKYFIVDNGKNTEYESVIRMATHFLGRETNLPHSNETMQVLNETPDGRFVSIFENPGPIMIPQAPVGPDDKNTLKFVPHDANAKRPRQGVEISEALAKEIMPQLGLNMHKIKDAPRERSV